MKFKISKSVKIIFVIAIMFILIGYGSYKLYFEKLFIFQEYEKMFLKSVEDYFLINKTFVPENGDYKNVTLQDMYDNGLIEALHVPKSDNFCNEDNSFIRLINEKGILRYVTYLECGKFKSKVDHTSPVIVINGDKKVIVNLYDSYQDAGLKTVIDDYDGVIDISKVEVYNKVDTSKSGNYEVVYKIYDKNFNVTRETRNVVVADNLNNIVKRDTNNENYYKGNVENNYLLFSGMLFRIVKINDNGSVKIVSDDNISHLSYTEDNYVDSNLRHWLNNYYLNHINENSKKYIVEGSWCVDDIPDVKNFTCNNKVKDMVGLLNTEEYLKTLIGKKGYLDGVYDQTLLINKKDKDTLYLTYGIDILDKLSVNNLYASVKPSLNLKENTYVISGNGSIDKPYMIGDYKQGSENNLLKDRVIGEYVKYSGYWTRITDFTDNGNIVLSFDEELSIQNQYGGFEKLFLSFDDLSNYKFNVDKEGNIGYLLNNFYIDYLNNQYLVEDFFNIPKINNNSKYDELDTLEFKGKIFIPYSFMMFSSANYHKDNMLLKYLYSDYIEEGNQVLETNINIQTSSIRNVNSNSSYTIRPIIIINKDAKIRSGKGTYSNPYILK